MNTNSNDIRLSEAAQKTLSAIFSVNNSFYSVKRNVLGGLDISDSILIRNHFSELLHELIDCLALQMEEGATDEE